MKTPLELESRTSLKNVLIIAYIYPPAGGGAVQRTLKFVKYLPSFGWRPVVLTPRKAEFDYFDYTHVDEISPEAKLYQTKSLEVPRWYSSLAEKYFDKSRADDRLVSSSSQHVKVIISLVRPIFSFVRWVAHNLIFVPDTRIGWIPFAVWKGMRVIKNERIEAIYATGDPWSDFLIGLFLSRVMAKPYIMDMRDPWTLSPDVEKGRVRSSIEAFWERLCIRRASKVINITEQATQAYRERYPDVDPSKFECITQGFDPPDFEDVEGKKTRTFTIATTGTYKEFKSPEYFLKALRTLIDCNPGLASEIRCRFMGAGGKIVEEFVEKYNLSDMVEVLPYGTHRESTAFMMNSDVLMLEYLPSVRSKIDLGSTSSRVFEFLATGKPILGLVYPTGAAAELILSTGSGTVVHPENTLEVAEAINSYYLQYKNGTLGVDSQSDLERFERKNLTGMLAKLLDQTTLV